MLDTKTQIGIKIKKLREKRGLTQEQLAFGLGEQGFKCSRVLVNHWESGTRVHADVILNISKYFKVPTDYLFGMTTLEYLDGDLGSTINYLGISEELALSFLDRKTLSQQLQKANCLDMKKSLQMADHFIAIMLEKKAFDIEDDVENLLNHSAYKKISSTVVECLGKYMPSEVSSILLFSDIKNFVKQYYFPDSENQEKINFENIPDWLRPDISNQVASNFMGFDFNTDTPDYHRFKSMEKIKDCYDKAITHFVANQDVEKINEILETLGMKDLLPYIAQSPIKK